MAHKNLTNLTVSFTHSGGIRNFNQSMKHVLTSAGLLALGAATLHAYDPEMSRQNTGRPWSIGATVRGFYDDNIATAPKDKQASFGVQVSPSVHVNLPLEQTFISLGYVYGLNWYDKRDPNIDQSHEFNARLSHQFSPQHDITVADSFVYSSEPSIVDQGGIVTSPIRTDSSVYHNNGSISDNLGLTKKWALGLGYNNGYYNYEQDGNGSRSALLDRIEQTFRADLRYLFNPHFVGLVGYNFGLNTYTGDEYLDVNGTGNRSNIRDSYVHRGYLGAEYDITAKLVTSLRIGGQFTDYHESGETSVTPYVDASLTYRYLPGGSLQFGIRHDNSATDVANVDTSTGVPTLDAGTTSVYAQLTHNITRSLTGSLNVQYQNSIFNNGFYNGKSEDYWMLGANLEYRFNNHWSVDTGYNYDNLNSQVPDRGFDRNRVYVGVHASY